MPESHQNRRESSLLHQHIHARLAEVFGQPESALNSDDHWSIKPASTAAAINILVNTSREIPNIWIFDPHSVNDGVMRIPIEREEQVDEVIKSIQQRIQKLQMSLDGH